MFSRWRQENWFKYMREEFLLDALVDYEVEPDDPERSVPKGREEPPEVVQVEGMVDPIRTVTVCALQSGIAPTGALACVRVRF